MSASKGGREKVTGGYQPQKPVEKGYSPSTGVDPKNPPPGKGGKGKSGK